MDTDTQITQQGSKSAELNRARVIFGGILIVLIGTLIAWIAWHVARTPADESSSGRLIWVSLYTNGPQQWLDWFYVGLIGSALYTLVSVSTWYTKANSRFIDFTPWYISTTIKGPIISVVILLFLTSVNIELAGLSVDFTELGPPVLLVVAFVLGFYNRVAREQLNQIVKAVFSRAYSAAEETFTVTPKKAAVVFGKTVQFKTTPETEVVWLASVGKIENGVYTAPSGTEAKSGTEVVITAVPSNPDIPRETAVATLLPFEIVGKNSVPPGSNEKYTVVPAPAEGVTWSFSPLVAGAGIDDQGILKTPSGDLSGLPQKVTLMATSKKDAADFATSEVVLTKEEGE